MIKNKIRYFNDPIYGFIKLQDTLLEALVEHHYFQRLRHISQTGLSALVYPGALHTRFQHAIGAVHLMQKAIQTLVNKGIKINKKEAQGLYIAILLHDIGHGPFSHALENTLLKGISHEKVSLYLMHQLNEHFKGKLSEAIAIFEGKHPKKFLSELISSQIDIDRLDYLKRDCFYTGVAEGQINVERIISMMNVKQNELVFDYKSLYSIERLIISRWFMYQQVYFHKTVVGAEHLLITILERVRNLLKRNILNYIPFGLSYFLRRPASDFSKSDLNSFIDLNDHDLWQALKIWQNEADIQLAKMCRMVINRNLPKVKVFDNEYEAKMQLEKIQKNKNNNKRTLTSLKTIINPKPYDNQHPIKLMRRDGDIVYLHQQKITGLNLRHLSQKITKYYVCYED